MLSKANAMNPNPKFTASQSLCTSCAAYVYCIKLNAKIILSSVGRTSHYSTVFLLMMMMIYQPINLSTFFDCNYVM